MNIKMTLQVNTTGKKYDISELVSDIAWQTQLADQPGKLTFKCVDDDVITFPRGSIINFEMDGKGVFYGYVFKDGIGDSGLNDVLAYDQLRYLQNKELYVVSGRSSSQIFEMVCKDKQLPNYKVVSPTTLIVPPRIHDNTSLFDVIDFGIGYELRTTGKWCILRDNFGVLEFIDLKKLATKLAISDNDLITNYNYEASIDSDTYNQVKIIQENRESKKGKPVKHGGKIVSRDYGFAKSDATINQWGLLQYTEKCDKHLNPVQLDMYAKSILSQKNRETKTYSLTAIGDLRVTAGTQMYIYIEKLKKELPNYTYFLVTDCTHRFKNYEHTMDLQVWVPQYGVELL